MIPPSARSGLNSARALLMVLMSGMSALVLFALRRTARRPQLSPSTPPATPDAPALLSPAPVDAFISSTESEDEPGADVRARTRVLVDWGLLALAAAAVLAAVIPIPAARTYLVFAAALVLPGAAIVTRFRLNDALSTAALVIGLSLALDTAGALVIVWSRWFHPSILAAVLLSASAAVLVADLRTRVSRPYGSQT